MTFQKFNPNENGRDFVCGDIHGCYSDLEEGMREIGFDPAIDRMFTVGDLTDRGPESTRAMHFLKENWFFSALGNHEDMILQCYQDATAPVSWHIQNGGKWIQDESEEWREEYITLIRKLPLVIQVGRYGIVHSTVPKGISWDNFARDAERYRNLVLWRRYKYYNEVIEGIKLVFSGHTINSNPLQLGSVLNIDTGAFKKYRDEDEGRLTIVEMNHQD